MSLRQNFLIAIALVAGLAAGAQQNHEKAFLTNLNAVLAKATEHHWAYEGKKMTIDSPFALRNGMLSVSLRYDTDTTHERVRLVAPLAAATRISRDRYLILRYPGREARIYTAAGKDPFPATYDSLDMFHMGNYDDTYELTDSVAYHFALLMQNKKLANWLFYYTGHVDTSRFVNDYIMVDRDGKLGFINRNLEFIAFCQYDMAFDFSEGLAPVQKNDLWGYIDTTGKVVIPFRYKTISDFENGRAEVKEPNAKKPYFIDRQGRKVKP